ncbi:MAG: hypothetical protein ABIS50_25195 [Luteolibacter sp.]|uniref:hypothetical protein n=1 Tax=Luteolibacter sp. TaxID=1962973 RepID=UPI003265001F
MARRQVFITAALVLIAVWACVWGIRAYAGTRKITAELVNREVADAKFADWSAQKNAADSAEAARREKELRKIAGLVNRLDFQEREKNRENRTGENFFRKLSPGEKGLFIDLTIVESMSRFMEAMDAMKPDQRKKFVEQGLKEIQNGKTGADMARADELGADLLDKISEEGMKAYFEKSSTDTKLDLAPLMEAMNEQMQGLRGNEIGPRQ